MIGFFAMGAPPAEYPLGHDGGEYPILRAIDHYQWKQNADKRVVLK